MPLWLYPPEQVGEHRTAHAHFSLSSLHSFPPSIQPAAFALLQAGRSCTTRGPDALSRMLTAEKGGGGELVYIHCSQQAVRLVLFTARRFVFVQLVHISLTVAVEKYRLSCVSHSFSLWDLDYFNRTCRDFGLLSRSSARLVQLLYFI